MRIILAFLLVLILGSCKTIFTAEMKIKLESNNVDLSSIQYYNSSKIVLKRNLLDSESNVEDGKIRMENGRRTQIIKLNKNTPGILYENNGDTLGLIFEEGENRTIPFTYSSSKDDFRFKETTLIYEGKIYRVYYPSGYAKVKVKKTDLSKEIKESRKMKGLKVSNQS